MTIQHGYLFFTVEEHEQILKSAKELEQNTLEYIEALKRIDQKIQDACSQIRKDPMRQESHGV